MCIPLKSTHAHDCPLLLREAQRSCVCFPGPALALHCREPRLHLTGWGSEHLNSRLPASGKQRQPRGGEKGLRGDGAEPTLAPRNTIRPRGGGRSGFGGRAPELQPRLSACPVWDQLSQSQRFDFKQATSRLSPEPQRSGAVAPWKPAPAVWTALLVPEHGRPGGSARRCAEGSPRDG